MIEIESMRRFAGLSIHRPIPDETTSADKLLHGEEECVWGDAGYVVIEKREEHKDRDVAWFIVKRPGKLKTLAIDSDERQTERLKAQVQAKVEHSLSQHYQQSLLMRTPSIPCCEKYRKFH